MAVKMAEDYARKPQTSVRSASESSKPYGLKDAAPVMARYCCLDSEYQNHGIGVLIRHLLPV